MNNYKLIIAICIILQSVIFALTVMFGQLTAIIGSGSMLALSIGCLLMLQARE